MYGCWFGGQEGVGRWGWAEVGCCAGEEGGDWVGHFFFFFGGGGLRGGRGESCVGYFFFWM